VKADAPNRLVQISVTGPLEGRPEGRRRLLAVIRSDFEHIHRSYRFKVEAFVPVRGRPGFAVEYEKLVAAENKGMRTFPEFHAGEFLQVDVTELLQGVNLDVTSTGRGSRTQLGADGRPAKLFISYSHRDDLHREALESHLKVLQMSGLVEVWHDRRIGAGGEWKGEIDEALNEADIVILLVSADFLASDYCNDVELPRALERQADGVCRVIPVIVRDARWQLSPIAKLQALPTDGKAVVTWPNVDTAWRVVAEGIEGVVKDLRASQA
jgi:internalin A